MLWGIRARTPPGLFCFRPWTTRRRRGPPTPHAGPDLLVGASPLCAHEQLQRYQFSEHFDLRHRLFNEWKDTADRAERDAGKRICNRPKMPAAALETAARAHTATAGAPRREKRQPKYLLVWSCEEATLAGTAIQAVPGKAGRSPRAWLKSSPGRPHRISVFDIQVYLRTRGNDYMTLVDWKCPVRRVVGRRAVSDSKRALEQDERAWLAPERARGRPLSRHFSATAARRNHGTAGRKTPCILREGRNQAPLDRTARERNNPVNPRSARIQQQAAPPVSRFPEIFLPPPKETPPASSPTGPSPPPPRVPRREAQPQLSLSPRSRPLTSNRSPRTARSHGADIGLLQCIGARKTAHR
ncbi:hypothetical protein H180DRAFT_00847 [Streptomyces sp. WMMB 322]|nr:hypothetical protein H180DRAFT_00847 [Streptomyces sp. WMMB 322]